METGRDLYQLDGHAQPVVGFANAALEQRSDAEMVADRAHVGPGVAKLKRGGPRRHAQTFDVGKRVDQLLGKALAQVVLIALRAHVREREDSNCRDIRRGRCPSGSVFTGRIRNRGDELVAAAMTRFDETRLPGVIVERPAQLLDARRQRIVADGGAVPHRREQIVFRDRPAGMRHQRLQHVGGFWRESDLSVAGP